MSSSYFESLDYGSQKRHVEKLKMREIEIPDPYSIADDLWVDNPAKWPNVEFGDIYIYRIAGFFRGGIFSRISRIELYS